MSNAPLGPALHKAIDGVLAQYPDLLLEPSWDSPLSGTVPEYAHAGHAVWPQIAPRLDAAGQVTVPGFLPTEFNEPYQMDVAFLRLLYRIRQVAGVPFRVVSDARDPHGDVGAKLSAHKRRPCRAVDIHVKNSFERMRVIVAAVLAGVRRLGVYASKDQNDAGSLHLDAEVHRDNPSPRAWTRY
jgi:hypothetical protein